MFINGDFNATSSIFECHFSFDGKKTSHFEMEASNNNGELMLNFCYSKKTVHP